MRKIIAFILIGILASACQTSQNSISTPMLPEGEAVAANDATPTVDIAPFVSAQNEWNFLILGSDYRDGDPLRENGHTDAFILVNIQEFNDEMKITFMPIARDLFLDDWGIINSVYWRNGLDETARMVQEEFGLKLDAIFITDMAKFVSLVDDLDGVKITAPQTFSDTCSVAAGEDRPPKKYNFTAGERYTLTGTDALCYVRMRHTANGFFDREKRMADVIVALSQKLGEKVVFDTFSVIDAVQNNQFVEVWPNNAWPELANLAIRSALKLYTVSVVALDDSVLISGTEIGPLLFGGVGEFYVHRFEGDLAGWVQQAISK